MIPTLIWCSCLAANWYHRAPTVWPTQHHFSTADTGNSRAACGEHDTSFRQRQHQPSENSVVVDYDFHGWNRKDDGEKQVKREENNTRWRNSTRTRKRTATVRRYNDINNYVAATTLGPLSRCNGQTETDSAESSTGSWDGRQCQIVRNRRGEDIEYSRTLDIEFNDRR